MRLAGCTPGAAPKQLHPAAAAAERRAAATVLGKQTAASFLHTLQRAIESQRQVLRRLRSTDRRRCPARSNRTEIFTDRRCLSTSYGRTTPAI